MSSHASRMFAKRLSISPRRRIDQTLDRVYPSAGNNKVGRGIDAEHVPEDVQPYRDPCTLGTCRSPSPVGEGHITRPAGCSCKAASTISSIASATSVCISLPGDGIPAVRLAADRASARLGVSAPRYETQAWSLASTFESQGRLLDPSTAHEESTGNGASGGSVTSYWIAALLFKLTGLASWFA